MRHGVKKPKLQRKASHRKALLANQACSLISHGRITTTLAKAKALRPYIEKLITLGKRGDLHARRQALATIPQPKCVAKLFGEIAAATANRQGGYTRIVKLGQRKTDSAPMALIEIIDLPQLSLPEAPATTTGTGSMETAPAAVETVEAPAPAAEEAPEAPAEEKKEEA